ncbi:MAG: hypothetical protein AB7F23_05300 [Phycisphaerae bacterium]
MENKSAIFDYFFGNTPDGELLEVERLINEDELCARFYSDLGAALSPLDSVREQCPDELFERCVAAASKSESQKTLEGLLRKESAIKHGGRDFLNTFVKIAAVILVMFMITAAWAPATSHMRSIANSIACQRNLADMGIALSNYAADNAGMLPLAETAGKSWWKVGSQAADEHSNTRNQWLLVRDGYAKMSTFECPSRPVMSDVKFQVIDVCDYQRDFPHKEFINYSFPIQNTNAKLINVKYSVFAADANPLFEENCLDKQTFFNTVRLDGDVKNLRSINHAGKGQNILLKDGSAKFTSKSLFGSDDIYTVNGLTKYFGNEAPATENDVFLAP